MISRDVRVDRNCIGSSPHHKERLSCVHNAGGEGQPCNMGRMEIWNPNVERPGAPQSGAWGSVCGQWLWNNNNGEAVLDIVDEAVLMDCECSNGRLGL